MHRAGMLCRLASPSRTAAMARSRTTIAATQLTKPESSTKHQARAQSAAASVKHESFMNGSTSVYIEQMYAAWQEDPNSVHKSWDAYFRNVEQGAAPGQAFQAPPTGGLTLTGITQPSAGAASTALSTAGASVQSISDHLKIQLLIRSYQMRGHNVAELDPLGINSADLDDTVPPELELSFYGLNENDLERDFVLPPSTYIGGSQTNMKLKDIIGRLKDIYCFRTGVEYMHLTNYEQQDWIRRRFEAPRVTELSRDQKKVLFKRLIRSTKFEEFLAKKWPSEKRFGLEGCEVLIPAIKQVIDSSSSLGVDSFVIGMPHRGRLNVLANVCRQPLATILSQFATLEPADEGSGDVKYHLGVCIERLNRQSQKNVKIAVVANPSHLEAVDPVVLGKVRAEAFYSGDHKCDRTMAIMLHPMLPLQIENLREQWVLPNYTTIIVLVNRAGNLSSPDRLQMADNLISTFESFPEAIGPETTHYWMRDYRIFQKSANEEFSGEEELDGNLMVKDPFTREAMKGFLEWPEFRHWTGFIKFNDEGRLDRFMATVSFHGEKLGEFNVRKELLERWRKVVDSFPALNASIFDDFCAFVDQTDSMVPATLSSSMVTLITMFVTCFVFMNSLFTIIIATLSIISICLGVFGFLALWSVNLDPISMSCLIMSIGFSVDFPAHIAFHFHREGLENPDSKPAERIARSLLSIGFPLLQCGLSTVLFVLCLICIKTYMGEVFVKTVFLVVSLGLLHGLVIVPSFLCTLSNLHSLIGKKRRGNETGKHSIMIRDMCDYNSTSTSSISSSVS